MAIMNRMHLDKNGRQIMLGDVLSVTFDHDDRGRF